MDECLLLHRVPASTGSLTDIIISVIVNANVLGECGSGAVFADGYPGFGMLLVPVIEEFGEAGGFVLVPAEILVPCDEVGDEVE